MIKKKVFLFSEIDDQIESLKKFYSSVHNINDQGSNCAKKSLKRSNENIDDGVLQKNSIIVQNKKRKIENVINSTNIDVSKESDSIGSDENKSKGFKNTEVQISKTKLCRKLNENVAIDNEKQAEEKNHLKTKIETLTVSTNQVHEVVKTSNVLEQNFNDEHIQDKQLSTKSCSNDKINCDQVVVNLENNLTEAQHKFTQKTLDKEDINFKSIIPKTPMDNKINLESRTETVLNLQRSLSKSASKYHNELSQNSTVTSTPIKTGLSVNNFNDDNWYLSAENLPTINSDVPKNDDNFFYKTTNTGKLIFFANFLNVS